MNDNPGDIRTAIDEARKPSLLFQDATPFVFLPNDEGGFTFKVRKSSRTRVASAPP